MNIRRFALPVAVSALILALVAGTWPPMPLQAQSAAIGPISQTFTSAASPPLRACGLRGENSATFQATGAGPIDAQVSNDGFSWTTATISTISGATQAQPFTPTSGTVYQVTPLNADCVQIAPDSTWGSQSVTITFKASGAIAAAPTPGGGGGGSTTVTCASPGCVVTQGTTPWVVNTAAPGAAATPSSGPLPTASAGAAAPALAPYGFVFNACMVPAGATPNVTAGNAIANQCDSNGAMDVDIPNPSATIPVTTPAPAPTVSPGLFPGTVQVCPSTAPAPINGVYTCTNTSSGFLNTVQAAAPAATTPVSCAAATNCPVNASQVTSPWVVGQATGTNLHMTVDNASPIPVVTPPPGVTLPTATPGGWAGVQPILYGTGATYVSPICDTFANSAAISTAVTTLLITGVTNQSIYICLATWQSTGTNATNTIQYEYGQGATCQTNTVTLLPAPTAPGTTSGGWLNGWAGGMLAASGVVGMPPPAAVPLIIPNNATAYNFCGVTAGTTTAGKFVVFYAIH
jgi:hypothetical protein